MMCFSPVAKPETLAGFVAAASRIAKLFGWLPNPPGHIRAETLRIDERVCRALRCGSCGRRGLIFNPLHRGNAYSVQGVCPTCGQVEQV